MSQKDEYSILNLCLSKWGKITAGSYCSIPVHLQRIKQESNVSEKQNIKLSRDYLP